MLFVLALSLTGRLFELCAGCDRGFAASKAERAAIEAVIDELPSCGDSGSEMLRQKWKLVYTSAPDVSTLNANPLVQVGAVYQDARRWPVVVNVIDCSPRIASALPPPFTPEIVTRINVLTRAEPRSEQRVGLTFERVEVQQPFNFPALGFNLPQIAPDSGYFDIRYLDDSLLVIQQNQPGGLFAFSKSDD